jgi:dipeptidyl aminopeptidase/acylaminoacyl peptidase
MNRTRFLGLPVLAILLLLGPGLLAAAQDKPADGKAAAPPAGPRPLALQDILAWKAVGAAELSPDGTWFLYRLSPLEGESEVVLRQVAGTKEYRFPIGEAPRYGSSLRTGFSADSKWAAFLSYPGTKEMKALRKDHKRVMTTAVLVDVATGTKTEFEKVRGLAFSGDNPAFVAFHRYAPESRDKEKDAWTGSDLLLRELASGKEINIGNVAEYAFDKAGARLALVIDAQGQAGNGLELRDMRSGALVSLDGDKAAYKSLAWSEKGEALAVLKGKEDKAFEDKLWSVVAFSGFQDAKGPRKTVYDPAADKSFPAGMTISPDRTPEWTESLDAVLFGIHEAKKKRGARDEVKAAPEGGAAAAPEEEELADEDIPDLVIWHGRDKRLQSEQQVDQKRDQAFSYLSEYRVADRTFLRLADDEVRDVEPAPKDRFAIGRDVRPYELDSNLDGRNYADIFVIDMKTGKRTPALSKCRYMFMPLFDGTRFLYYDDGHFYTYDMTTGRSVNITKDVPASFVNEDDDHNVVKPPDYPVGSSKDGQNVILSDGWDIWAVPANGVGRAVNLTGNGAREEIRYRRVRIDPEEKGIDLGQPQYVAALGERTKKAGLGRIEKGRPGAAMLLWEDAGFGGLAKAENADVFVYTRDTYKDYPDYYAADALLRNGRRLTEANPQQKDFLWSSGSVLLDYKMDPKSGMDKSLQAALFLPANYEKGKRYPTIVYYYEKMSQQLNRYAQPSANGFNKSVYTSNGYAVLYPDIAYKVNDPGMSAAWCVLPAIEAAVAAGVVDRSKIGLQGHSWGGYETAFLITQADFAAAVAGAPLTNMISMYSSIYFNTGSANQPIFESSQGRFKGGYWDNLEAYQRNSPVYYAAQVHTPLIILHNDKDGAVVWNQGIEYFNTLRRLKKPIVMLQYVGENHGLQKPANQKDYTVRMKEFFDHYLMGRPAPAWYTDGVPYLELKDHLKERAKALRPAPAAPKKDGAKK